MFDVVVACGGDGTVKEVANGIAGSNAVLGVLPLGGGNDFAKSIGLTRNFHQNLDILLSGAVKHIDVIKSSYDEIFLNTFGIGLDGLTNYYASRLTFLGGTLKYVVAGLEALFQVKPFVINFSEDGAELNMNTWMVIAANGAFEGGKYHVSPGSNNKDGIFEITIVKNVPRWRLIIAFMKLTAGFSFNKKIVKTIRCSESFSFCLSEPMIAHADGEVIKSRSKFKFTIKKEYLPVINNA